MRRRLFAIGYETVYQRLEPAAWRRIRRILAGRAFGRVLELGVGIGINLPYYGEHTEVYGLDPDPAMLAYARRRLCRASLVLGCAEDIPFPNAYFDTVISTLTFCTVRNPLAAALEVRRVLRLNGVFLFMEHVLSSSPVWAWCQQRLTPVWRRVLGGCHPDRQTLKTFAKAGLHVNELHQLGGALLPVMWGNALVLQDHSGQGRDKDGREQVAHLDFSNLQKV